MLYATACSRRHNHSLKQQYNLLGVNMHNNITILKSAKLIVSTVTYASVDYSIYTIALNMTSLSDVGERSLTKMVILGPLSGDMSVMDKPTLHARLKSALGKRFEKYDLKQLSLRDTDKIKSVVRNITDVNDKKKYAKSVDVTHLTTDEGFGKYLTEYGYDYSLSVVSKTLLNMKAWTVDHVNRSISLKIDESLTVFFRYINGHRYDALIYANGTIYDVLDSCKVTRSRFIKMLASRYFDQNDIRAAIDNIHKPCLTKPIYTEETEEVRVTFKSLPYLITNTRKNIKLDDVVLKRTNTPHGLDLLDVSARTCMGVLLDFDEPLESLEILNAINKSVEDIYILTKKDAGYDITPYNINA